MDGEPIPQKSQPWKQYLSDPGVKPFTVDLSKVDDEREAKTHMTDSSHQEQKAAASLKDDVRLIQEKDLHCYVK
ncbi:hypothetical protein LTR10_013994 [Elasticomyces elasticus]|nr:hypothetical protein LTR10_013994 [Elasticomyces elasticus]